MKLLGSQPVLRYTIEAARLSGVFSQIVVCSDDEAIFRYVCCSAPAWGDVSYIDRAPVPDHQADIVWVKECLAKLPERVEAFAILRPTSPFRTADTIRRAFKKFTLPDQTADSVRAVEPVRQHPGKMWALDMGRITPLLDYKRADGVPWHSCPTQSLPTFYVQNSSLEMAWTSNVETWGTIHGRKIAPFFCEGYEGFSVDYPDDWARAEQLVASGAVVLPRGSSPQAVTVGPSQ